MHYENLILDQQGAILILTVNRPEKHNALNIATLKEISNAISYAVAEGSIRGILITGAGSRAFISGADISEFVGLHQNKAEELARFGQSTLKQLETCPKPILAAINGFAYGGGCELAMACHLRIASSNARFSQPEVNLGIMAGYGGTQRLIQYIGKTKAMEMHLTGRVIDAEQALKLGLLNDVVSPDVLLERSKGMLNEITKKSSETVSRIIKTMNGYFENDGSGYELEVEEFGKCFVSDDFKEGIQAFFEKREPKFK